MKKGTKTTLVRDLHEALMRLLETEPEDSPKALAIIKISAAAKKGDYHDYESEIDTPFPKMLLHDELMKAGLPVIAEAVRHGDYDEDPFEKEVKNDN